MVEENADWVDVRRGGRGRKLQAEGGRVETRENISERRRCCREMSCEIGK